MRRAPAAAAAAVAAVAAAAAAVGACRSGEDGSVHPDVAAAVKRTRAAHPELFRRKVVVLGFNSCDPDLVEQYVREGRLPHFAQLIREGARGALHSIQPTLSPVVWTTIATGMPPQRHGILDFITETPAGPVPVSSRMRQADTVWDLLSNQGEKVGVVGWLVTWPAEKLNGFLVTDRIGHLAFEYLYGAPTDTGQITYPESLAAELAEDSVDAKDVPLAKVRPFLDITQKEFDATYSPNFDPRNKVGNLRLILATAETIRNAGERLLAEEKPRFFACYFEAMDAVSHLFMPYAPPKAPGVPTDLYMKYRSAIEANYVWHDRVLGEFMAQCDADTTVIVVSDHGFKNGDFRMADASDFHAKTGAMWHRPYGVFYAWGNGVKRGATVAGARVYDIAPTVLAAMGYPVPEEMPGRVLADAFEDGLPFETVPTYHGEARRDAMARLKAVVGEQTARSPDEEDALKKLESLGYIGGDRSDPVSARLNKGTADLAQGRVEAAYKEFKGVLDGGERVPRVLDAVAEACLRTGRLDEAEKCIAESLAKDSSGFCAVMLRARALLARRKFPEAEAAARAALQQKSDVPAAWQTLALVLQVRLDDAEKTNDAEAAAQIQAALIEAQEGALRLEPRQAQGLVDLARTRLSGSAAVKDAEKARDELNRALELVPGHISALNNRAIALLRLGVNAKFDGRAEEADRLLSQALESAEKAVSLAESRYGPGYRGYDKGWANKAYVLWHMGRTGDAAAAAGKARSIEPSYAFNARFVAAMAEANHVISPPAPKQP